MKCARLLGVLVAGLLTGGAGLAWGEANAAKEKPAVMVTREYQTPLNFLTTEDAGKVRAYPAEKWTMKATLEGWGVPFPEGAEASFSMANNRLVVRNTEENLELVNYLVEERRKVAPRCVVAHAVVIEGPGKLMREMNAAAARKMSAVKEMETLLALAQANAKEPKVRVVGDAWLEARPGMRARTETVRELLYANGLSLDAKGGAALEMEMRMVGLRLDLEAYVENEGQQIGLTSALDLFPALPQSRPMNVSDLRNGHAVEFPVADVRTVQFAAGFSVFNGDTKIMGIAKLGGHGNAEGEDVLWMAFITVRARPVEVLPVAAGAGAAGTAKATTKSKKLQEAAEALKQIAEKGDEGESDFFQRRPLTSFFTLHTVQAPAPFLRALAGKAMATGDHAGVWREIEAAAARGEVSFVDSHALEAKPGVKAEVHAAREWVYPGGFGADEKGQPEISFEMRPVGSRLSLEPTLSDDAQSLSVEVDYELHTAPPKVHRDVFGDATSQQKLEMAMPDFHTAHVVTGVTMVSGSTRLLTLWKPEGRGDAEVLWATFLHGDVVLQKVPEKPLPVTLSGTIPLPDKNEWISRPFRVPPDFARDGKSVQQVLEEVGIAFPEGAKAYLEPKSGRLIVRNQRAQMELVESYIETACGMSPPCTFVFTTHVVQGPGPLIRRMMSEVSARCDHRPQMEKLLASAEVKHLETARIETKAGLKATARDVLEHKALAEVSVAEDGRLLIAQDMRPVGFQMELEATSSTGSDLIEVVLAPEFHTAEAQEHRELLTDTQGRRLEFPLTHYHAAKVSTATMIPDGAARLLGVWRPTGKPEFETGDVLQAVFITCDVLPVVVYQER